VQPLEFKINITNPFPPNNSESSEEMQSISTGCLGQSLYIATIRSGSMATLHDRQQPAISRRSITCDPYDCCKSEAAALRLFHGFHFDGVMSTLPGVTSLKVPTLSASTTFSGSTLKNSRFGFMRCSANSWWRALSSLTRLTSSGISAAKWHYYGCGTSVLELRLEMRDSTVSVVSPIFTRPGMASFFTT
jgi:hypothetical protein